MKRPLLVALLGMGGVACGVLSGCSGKDARKGQEVSAARPPLSGGKKPANPRARSADSIRKTTKTVDSPKPVDEQAERVRYLAERAKVCAPTRSHANFPPTLESENFGAHGSNAATDSTNAIAVRIGRKATFADIKAALAEDCVSCHGAPAAGQGRFSFVPDYEGRAFIVRGESKPFPGIKDTAERLRDAILRDDVETRMPYGGARDGREAEFEALGKTIDAWIQAGKPAEGDFVVPDASTGQGAGGAMATPTPSGPGRGSAPDSVYMFEETDIGDCIPDAGEAGVDPEMDAYFSAVETFSELPKTLSETDMFTLDSLRLARAGTFSYNVEYPLWADNAEKGRYVHLPAVQDENGKWMRAKAILRTEGVPKFELPDNTRFYKSFYKAVVKADGRKTFRRIETRLIVVRKAPRTPLYATYQWNDANTEATLVDTPYRDGRGFKDKLFLYENDEGAHSMRKYAIPGEQRCAECHRGEEGAVIGFTPLQLNRRNVGEGGRTSEMPVGEDELLQVKRLVDYGVLGGVNLEGGSGGEAEAGTAGLPTLENAKGLAPRNDHELRLQGYMVGNCAHCHNPNGFAMKDNQVKLELTAGSLYSFVPRAMRSIHANNANDKLFVDTKALVGASGDSTPGSGVSGITRETLRRSYLYLRVSATSKDRALLPYNAMPMHTPGGSNCRLVNLVAKWSLAVSGLPAQADEYNEPCEPRQDFSWIDLDTTEPKVYEPRRADWNTQDGMPELFRSLVYDDGMHAIASKRYPMGFYDTKAECRFETPNLPTNLDDPFYQKWMWKGGDKTQGVVDALAEGRLYTIKPGAYLYNSMCAKCHGTRADGQGPYATSLNVFSDGDIRVANFTSGLFKQDGSGLKQFDVRPSRVLIGSPSPEGNMRNLGGNYLIWMAMGGTKVNFPPEVSDITGKHKALMLNLVRDKCAGFLPDAPAAVGQHYYEYGLMRDVCFHDNGDPAQVPPELGFDSNTLPPQPLDAAKQDAWLDKAAFNGGWAIFEYLKSDASQDKWQPQFNECEKEHPLR